MDSGSASSLTFVCLLTQQCVQGLLGFYCFVVLTVFRVSICSVIHFAFKIVLTLNVFLDNSFLKKDFFIFILCICMFYLHICQCTTFMQCPWAIRRGCQILWNSHGGAEWWLLETSWIHYKFDFGLSFGCCIFRKFSCLPDFSGPQDLIMWSSVRSRQIKKAGHYTRFIYYIWLSFLLVYFTM